MHDLTHIRVDTKTYIWFPAAFAAWSYSIYRPVGLLEIEQDSVSVRSGDRPFLQESGKSTERAVHVWGWMWVSFMRRAFGECLGTERR